MHASDISELSDRQHCLVILNDSLFTSHSLSKRQCDPCYVHVIIPSFCRSLCRLPSDYPDVVVNGTSQPFVTMTTASVSRKTKNISFSAIFNLSFWIFMITYLKYLTVNISKQCLITSDFSEQDSSSKFRPTEQQDQLQ